MTLEEARKAAIEELTDRGASTILRHREEWDEFSVLMDKAVADWHVDTKQTGRTVRALRKTALSLVKRQDRERREFGL